MSSTKYEGLSHLTHFLKSRVSVVGDTFLITELNKPAFFANKAKKKIAPVVTQFIVKV